MDPDLVIRAMTRPELDTLVDWAAAEGWNPGLGDAQIFWDTDPAGFIAAERDGELIGGGSIVAYGDRFGFMGFFIVRPDQRSQGLGRRLWVARRDRLIARLRSPAVIGMDGVFTMQSFYARGGFVLSHRDLRFAGVGVAGALDDRLVDLAEVPFATLASYDAAHFPAPGHWARSALACCTAMASSDPAVRASRSARCSPPTPTAPRPSSGGLLLMRQASPSSSTPLRTTPRPWRSRRVMA
mgnify:CR=1 FL=1